MCAALLGLMAVCSTIVLPSRSRLAEATAGVEGGRERDAPYKRDAIEVDVEIAVRRGFYAADSLNRSERWRQFLRDCRGGLSQPASELERDRRREVAELALGGILDRELRQLVRRNLVQLLEHGQHSFPQTFVNWKNHERIVIISVEIECANIVIRGVEVEEQNLFRAECLSALPAQSHGRSVRESEPRR